jgi:hypothetical protein
MKWRELFKNRGLGVNLLASFCFLMLAVYGWGMTWKDLGIYLMSFLVVMGLLISGALLLAWLLRKFQAWRNAKN